jgi:hypothetical protein
VLGSDLAREIEGEPIRIVQFKGDRRRQVGASIVRPPQGLGENARALLERAAKAHLLFPDHPLNFGLVSNKLGVGILHHRHNTSAESRQKRLLEAD